MAQLTVGSAGDPGFLKKADQANQAAPASRFLPDIAGWCTKIIAEPTFFPTLTIPNPTLPHQVAFGHDVSSQQ